jgi:D-alanine-D-alanine ligase
MKQVRIAVLFGGQSNEHDVSLSSGEQIIRHMDSVCRVKPVYITRSGLWHIPHGFIAPDAEFSSARWIAGLPSLKFSVKAEDLKNDIDLAFIALHGQFGEDGRLQGLLEFIGIPYTGSGVLGSALSFNKVQAKRVFLAEGVPTPPFSVISRTERREQGSDFIPRLTGRYGFPIVIKAIESGSSCDMGIVASEQELEQLLDGLFLRYEMVMAEEYIRGDEFSCGVLDIDKDTTVALPPTQIIPVKSIYFDYKAKYEPGASREITPAPLTSEKTAEMQQLSLYVHRLLGCSGFSRVDFLERDNRFFVLEINTLPGMTPTSLLPQQAAAFGISYSELISKIIRRALPA